MASRAAAGITRAAAGITRLAAKQQALLALPKEVIQIARATITASTLSGGGSGRWSTDGGGSKREMIDLSSERDGI